MSFFHEIASVLGLDEATLAIGYHYINYNGKAVYVEGVKKVLRIGADELAFQMPKGVLYVGGTDLRIGDLTGAAVLVCGEILYVCNGAGKERLQIAERQEADTDIAAAQTDNKKRKRKKRGVDEL